MTRGADVIRASLEAERMAGHLYARLAALETGKAARLFAELGAESATQAERWVRELERLGEPVPTSAPGVRVRLAAWLLGWVGPRRMLPVLSAMKVRGLTIYRGGDGESVGAAGGPVVAEESWHRAARGGGALRAAVFGVNDGLLSNASLIIGIAGANPDPKVTLLAGVAGLLAGGFSMAAGEYISVRTQRELLEHQLALEREEMREMPEEEVGELTLIYRAKGLDAAQAEALARRIVGDPERGLETLAREELGLDPRGLASPTAAAVASFLSFAVGAVLPLLPHMLARGRIALVGTIVAAGAGLLGVGASMSLFTGRSVLWSAVRMVLLGASAAGLSYAVGRLLGVSIG
jgi:VIT1/CCC1 family predicted Fe2+/Mn2+ transporter